MEMYTNQNNENVEVMAVVVMVGVEESGADGYKNDTYKTLIHGLVGGWLGRWAYIYSSYWHVAYDCCRYHHINVYIYIYIQRGRVKERSVCLPPSLQK